jgi:homoserine O-acetyltransferase
MMRNVAVVFALALAWGHAAYGAPAATPGDFVIPEFRFASGETLPALKIHYRTFGEPHRDASGRVTNAVLVLHGTTGSGEGFLGEDFAGFLFVPGGLLDAAMHYVVIPDGIGHGKSSKPSDGLHARFPRYGYEDMVTAQYRLLTEGLHVDHLRLVMGTSMGGMHTWVWGETYPDFMDALLPLASLPVAIAGRNRAWRKAGIDAIRMDPEFKGGDYERQPGGLRVAIDLLYFVSSNPVLRQKDAPTRDLADRALEEFRAARSKTMDANDTAYALDASRDYDPQPRLGEIRAPLLAINTADDLINPPELGILEREVKRVPHGRAVVLPLSEATRGSCARRSDNRRHSAPREVS